jgi:hypothetical protein
MYPRWRPTVPGHPDTIDRQEPMVADQVHEPYTTSAAYIIH